MGILLSIIIPVYNTDCFYLEKCFESVTNQIFDNFEVIVIDSSSKQNIIDFIGNYSFIDKRFKIIRSKKGVSYQRNVGIENSNGKYIAFIDSDDYISKDYFKILIDAIQKNSADIVFPRLKKETFNNKIIISSTYLDYIPLNERITKDNFFENTPLNGLINPIKVYSRQIIGETRFNINLSYGEDMMFNYELSKKGFVAKYCSSAVYTFSSDINLNSAIKRLSKQSIFIIKELYCLYKREKKMTPKVNLDGILYQFNYSFEIFYYACVEQHKTLFLLSLFKYRLFYLVKNKIGYKKRLYFLFPYTRIFLKNILVGKKENK